MTSVSLMLSSNTTSLPTPSTPAFYLQGTNTTKLEAEDYGRQSLQGIGTAAEISGGVTITEMDPR